MGAGALHLPSWSPLAGSGAMMAAVLRRLPKVLEDPSPSFLLRQVLREEGGRGASQGGQN